jgi:hypothetical protein
MLAGGDMPEPYKFPKLPADKFTVNCNDPKLPPLQLGVIGEVPLLIMPPVEATNYIGFVVLGDREVMRLACVLGDNEQLVWIKEDGMIIEMKDIVELVFKIVLGSERYEKMNADEILERAKPTPQPSC